MEKVVHSAEQKLEEMDTTDEKTEDMEDTEEKKSHSNYEKNYRYKIDNIYQKAKIKNLE